MGFDTIIRNGTVVTATDSYVADVAMIDGKIAAIGKDLPAENASRFRCAGKFVLPGGIDVHTHLDMPFGGTTSADDFETGTRAAAFGGTTTLIDFAIQYKGQPLRHAFDTWMQQGFQQGCLRLCLSLHRHRPCRAASCREMNDLVREGVTSFKLFMAYPGVFMLDDASIFKALQTTSKNGGLVCMHAENGSAIDVIVQQALAEGKKAPKYHALTRPTTAEAEATASRDRSGGDGGRAGLHRPPELQ